MRFGLGYPFATEREHDNIVPNFLPLQYLQVVRCYVGKYVLRQ